MQVNFSQFSEAEALALFKRDLDCRSLSEAKRNTLLEWVVQQSPERRLSRAQVEAELDALEFTAHEKEAALLSLVKASVRPSIRMWIFGMMLAAFLAILVYAMVSQ